VRGKKEPATEPLDKTPFKKRQSGKENTFTAGTSLTVTGKKGGKKEYAQREIEQPSAARAEKKAMRSTKKNEKGLPRHGGGGCFQPSVFSSEGRKKTQCRRKKREGKGVRAGVKGGSNRAMWGHALLSKGKKEGSLPRNAKRRGLQSKKKRVV